MKKLIWIVLLAVVSITSAKAQVARDRAILRIKSDIECQTCQNIIQKYFEREPGIISMRINYRINTITVTYKPSRTNPSVIRTAIANLGFNADSVKANPDFASRLPPCCRKEGLKPARMEELEKRKGPENKADSAVVNP